MHALPLHHIKKFFTLFFSPYEWLCMPFFHSAGACINKKETFLNEERKTPQTVASKKLQKPKTSSLSLNKQKKIYIFESFFAAMNRVGLRELFFVFPLFSFSTLLKDCYIFFSFYIQETFFFLVKRKSFFLCFLSFLFVDSKVFFSLPDKLYLSLAFIYIQFDKID